MTISSRLGPAVTAGVPVLVLVSLGPVAGLAGTASIVVWSLSALMGLFMAVVFAELALDRPRRIAGTAAAPARMPARSAARVKRRRPRARIRGLTTRSRG